MTIGRIPSVEGGIQPTIVDAKGDLIAGVAADSINRLAVGSNDQVLVADSSASTGLAWKSVATPFAAGKNKIINGDFAINQRNFTTTTTTGAFGFDRWFFSYGTGTVTYSTQNFTPGSAPVSGYEGKTFARISTTGQSAANAFSIFRQPIESVRTLAGQTATISFWAKANSGTPKIAVELTQNFGTGGSPSSASNNYVGQVTISTSWARYSITYAIPSISGKTLGTTDDGAVYFNLWTSAGSDYNSRTGSMGIQNADIDIWGVQVEAGNVATPFQTATGTLQGELAACQRYYWRQTGPGAYATYANGYAQDSITAWFLVKNPVVMRTAPTSIDWSSLAVTTHGLGQIAISAIAFGTGTASPFASAIQCTSTGMTAYRMYDLANQNNVNGYIGFSAEL